MELKPRGVLVLIDLDNLPRAVRTLDDYMAENEDHPVCEVIAYASMGFNPGEELPEYVQLRRASSLDRDAADILMVFEVNERREKREREREEREKLRHPFYFPAANTYCFFFPPFLSSVAVVAVVGLTYRLR